MKAAVAALVACLIASPAASGASGFDMSQIYSIDRGHSYVGFQVRYMGFAKVRGRFSEFDGTLRFDPTDPAATSVTARITVGSIDTENSIRDRDLVSDNWLAAAEHPQMLFRSRRAEPRDGGFDLVGDLTLRGVTREVRLEMEEFSGVRLDIRDDSQVIWVGRTAIDRKEFGVAGERWSRVKEGITGVESTVEIELTILGKRINAPNFRNWVSDTEQPPGRIYQTLTESGVDAALTEFDEMFRDDPAGRDARVLGIVGQMLIKEGRLDDAVRVLTRNRELFPDEPRVFDSLAEAYAWKGELQSAAENYRLVLEKDPDDVHAAELLRHLGDGDVPTTHGETERETDPLPSERAHR